MDIYDRIHQINQGFPESFSTYPKPVVFSVVPTEEIDFCSIISTGDTEASLYVHIPFCAKKCSFCFIDIAVPGGHDVIEGYIERLLGEIIQASKGLHLKNIKSVYIGGGTPTMLQIGEIEKICEAITSHFPIREETIWEIDATSITLTRSMLSGLSQLGIKHLNIGIQSTEEGVLRKIGREWQTNTNLERVGKMIQEYGFFIHLDFIIGLPGEHISTFRSQIDMLYEIFHPSSFSINIYEETLYSPDFYTEKKHLYPRYTNLSKLAGILDQYIAKKFLLGREQTPYIQEFRQKRKNVLAFGAGAFGYIRGYGVYKNPTLKQYMEQIEFSGARHWIHLPLQDEKLMFLMQNYASSQIENIYMSEFNSEIRDDFPGIFEEGNKDYIDTTKASLKFSFRDNAMMQRFFIQFYSDKILEIYKLLTDTELKYLSGSFNSYYGA